MIFSFALGNEAKQSTYILIYITLFTKISTLAIYKNMLRCQ